MCSDPLLEGEDALARLDAHAAAEDQMQAEVEGNCPVCGGFGDRQVMDTSVLGCYDPISWVTCDRCGGTGSITPDDSPKPPSDDVEAIAEAFSGKEAAKR